MQFEPNHAALQWGARVGFLLSYFLFTTMLFFILWSAGHGLSYFYVMGITAFVAVVGESLRGMLK